MTNANLATNTSLANVKKPPIAFRPLVRPLNALRNSPPDKKLNSSAVPFPISFIMLKDSPIALNGSRKPSFIISKNCGRPFSLLPVSTVVPTSFACSSLSPVNLSNFKAFASILFFVSPFSLGERLSLSCKFLVSSLISFSKSLIVLVFFSINFSSCLICDLVNISTSFVSLLTRATIFCSLNFCTVCSDLRA